MPPFYDHVALAVYKRPGLRKKKMRHSLASSDKALTCDALVILDKFPTPYSLS